MTEKEQLHRHDIDQKTLQAKASDIRRGQWLGGAVALIAVGGAIAVASTSPWVAVALVGVPVMGMVQAIVKGRTEKGHSQK